jgi:phage/plasmid-like protein (TIGR03299 family)
MKTLTIDTYVTASADKPLTRATNVDAITRFNNGLSWEVKTSPIRFGTNGIDEKSQAIYTEHNGKELLLSTFSERYVPVQNSTLFDTATEALAPFGLKPTVAASLKNRKLVFISFQTGNDDTIGGEGFKRLIHVMSSHDGSCSVMMKDSNTRIICLNTFVSVSKSTGTFELTAKHTKTVMDKLEGWEKGIEKIFAARKGWAEIYQRLKNTNVTKDEARYFITGFLGKDNVNMPNEDKKLSTKTENKSSEVFALFNRGRGNNGETLGDIFNGVTEFFTHSASKDEEKRFFSSNFGLGADRKAEAFDLLSNPDSFTRYVAKGKALTLAA